MRSEFGCDLPDADSDLKHRTQTAHKQADADQMSQKRVVTRATDTGLYDERHGDRTTHRADHLLQVKYIHSAQPSTT